MDRYIYLFRVSEANRDSVSITDITASDIEYKVQEGDGESYTIRIDIQAMGQMVARWKAENPDMNFSQYEGV